MLHTLKSRKATHRYPWNIPLQPIKPRTPLTTSSVLTVIQLISEKQKIKKKT